MTGDRLEELSRQGGQHLGAGGSRHPLGGRARGRRKSRRRAQEADVCARAQIRPRRRAPACWCRFRRSCATMRICRLSIVAQPDGSFARRHVTLGSSHRRPVRHRRRAQGRRPDRGRRRASSFSSCRINERRSAAARSRAANARSIMNRIVASSLRQRFLIALMTLLLIGAGRARWTACRWMPIPICRRRWSRSSPNGPGAPPRKWSG